MLIKLHIKQGILIIINVNAIKFIRRSSDDQYTVIHWITGKSVDYSEVLETPEEIYNIINKLTITENKKSRFEAILEE